MGILARIGIGSMDEQYIESLIEDLESIGGDGYEAFKYTENFDITDANSWIEAIMTEINNTMFYNCKEVFDRVTDKVNNDIYLALLCEVKTEIDKMENPEIYTNCLDSHFQNVLDSVSFTDLESAVKEVFKITIDNVELNHKHEKLIKEVFMDIVAGDTL